MSNPKVSIGIPVYNGGNYLRQALDSLLHQEYEDYEIIISDNASTDGTADICREYSALDKRIRYSRNEKNIGPASNFNRVFDLARGELFKWLSHDDECYPNMLSRCVAIMEKAPDSVVMVYPQCEVIDEDGRSHGNLEEFIQTTAKQPYQRLYRVLLKTSSALALCGLIRSRYLKQTRPRGSYIAEDCVLLAELAMLGEIWGIPEVLWKLRVHSGNAVRRCPTQRSLMTWFDPDTSRKRFLLPVSLKRSVEYFESVKHAQLKPIQKLICYNTVLFVYCWRPIHDFAGRQKRDLLQYLHEKKSL